LEILYTVFMLDPICTINIFGGWQLWIKTKTAFVIRPFSDHIFGQKCFFLARIPRNFSKRSRRESQKLFGQECLRVLDTSKKVFGAAANFWEIWGFQKYPQAKGTIKNVNFNDYWCRWRFNTRRKKPLNWKLS